MSFKVGDRVMITEKDWYGVTDYGSVGTITELNPRYSRCCNVYFDYTTGHQHENAKWEVEIKHLIIATKLAKLLAGIEDE